MRSRRPSTTPTIITVTTETTVKVMPSRPGGQRFVEVHAESQSDDAVLQQFFRSLLAPDRKWIAEGQGEENAREERDDGRTEERTCEQSGQKGFGAS